VLRTSFAWLVTLPLLARGVTALPDAVVHHFTPFPFSWKAFYFAAVFTAIGNLIYLLRCPHIVRSYESFADFEKAGRGTEQLRRELEHLCIQYHKKIRPVSLAKTLHEFAASFCTSPLTDADRDAITCDSSYSIVKASALKIKPNFAGQAFWSLRDFADQLVARWRWACFLAFTLGLLLVAVVFLQNVLFVSSLTVEDWRSSKMAMQSDPAQPAPKTIWIEFDGEVYLEGSVALLRPALDPEIELRFRATDVRNDGLSPLVRSGARFTDLIVPEGSVLKTRTNRAPPGQTRCAGNPTMCLGGIEICCHNRQVVDSCVGYWRCP
jgi:hypothetical protein